MFRPNTNTNPSTSVRYLSLDSWSDRTVAGLAGLCFLTFIGLVCVLVNASLPPSCGCRTGQHGPATEGEVNISGVYLLDQVENYGKYLLAMDIPEIAVRNIETMKSEKITVKMMDGEKKVKIRTDTAWASKELEFLFGKNFSVVYGEQGGGGVLDYYCHRPQQLVINCRSFEKERNWQIVFDFIFSEGGLVNKSFFVSKHIGMKKTYKRQNL